MGPGDCQLRLHGSVSRRAGSPTVPTLWIVRPPAVVALESRRKLKVQRSWAPLVHTQASCINTYVCPLFVTKSFAEITQSPKLVAFEHRLDPSGAAPQNTLLFLGGLSDGLLTVPYTPHLAKALPSSYSLVEVLLSSCYSGWGTSDLGQDVKEIAECVTYFRNLRPGGTIALMGSSTGSQDVMHYLLAPGERPKIDGGILQAGISDREVIEMMIQPRQLQDCVQLAQKWVREGKEKDILPESMVFFLPAPVSAKRFLSLASPGPEHAGEDDYFSSDLSDERLSQTFGKIGSTRTPLCILFGEKDPHVPAFVDKAALVKRWISHIEKGGGLVDQGSGVVPGATHTLKELGPPMEDLIHRTVVFLDTTRAGYVGTSNKSR